MGNKMCKKKSDKVDGNPKSTTNTATTPSAIDRIISRLHLKPNTWKSDSNLSAKRANRSGAAQVDCKNGGVIATPQLNAKSKSSDWTEASLEVPEKEAIHLKNPQLSFIFNDNSTPTPPPRKHKKSIREKIETVAKNSIQALQSIKSSEDSSKKAQSEEPLKPAEEIVCVKKTIYYGCPCGNREHCQHQKSNGKVLDAAKSHEKKDSKRKKNLSVISLPNYSDLKLSVAGNDDNLRHIDSSNNDSANSLPGEEKQAGKLENYMTRCRSFGSLLNNKLKVPKEPADVESDDSFGGLEDWDLGILEHYNPKDASLPRPRKSKPNDDVLYDLENLIVSDYEVVKAEDAPPRRPVRRSESLDKGREVSPVFSANERDKDALLKSDHTNDARTTSGTERDTAKLAPSDTMPNDDQGEEVTEHSTLMKILQKYSVQDVQERGQVNEEVVRSSAPMIMRVSEKAIAAATSATENFIAVEKQQVY